MNQQTLRETLQFSGRGIHTGAECRVRVHPAEANNGRVFQVEGVRIPARTSYVKSTTRCTTLGADGVQVSTVEHLLAALAGCGIDNALIEVEGPEIPILDGSALPFVDLICRTGIEDQGCYARTVVLEEHVCVERGSSRMEAMPASQFSIEIETTFADWPEGDASNFLQLDIGGPLFIDLLSPARTFAFQSEVDALLAAGLAKGGSLDNVLIITPPASFSTPLRMSGEWWRHKVLDMIGDLALVDARLQMAVKGIRPGHSINTQFAQTLAALGADQI